MGLNWLMEKPVCHRGLHGNGIPENSISAFKNAIDHNFNIELDVQLTKDKKLIVFHDYNLKRLFGIKKSISSTTFDEIRKLKLPGTNEQIPTFEEVLDFVDNQTGILCEIKGLNPYYHGIEATADNQTKNYSGRLAFQSFNFEAVKYLKQHSDFNCGQLASWRFGNKERSFMLNYFGKLKVIKNSEPDFIAYDVRSLNPKFKENTYLKSYIGKLPILLWTVNSEEKIKIAEEFSANIIFEKIPLDLVETFINNKK